MRRKTRLCGGNLSHTLTPHRSGKRREGSNKKKMLSLTWEMLILDPLEPDTTMDLKLLNSDRDF